MKSIGNSLAATILICCLLNTATLAQPLPTDKNEALNFADKDLIEDYASIWASQLVAEDDRQVSAAKAHLLIPLGANPTQFFIIEYRAALRKRLGDVFDSKPAASRLIVRLNVMFVAAELNDTGSIDLLIKGLKDQNPAVRYWAAQAIASLTTGESLKTQQRNKLLVALTVAMENEKIESILIQTVRALVGLTKHVPDAMSTLLETINKRLELHVANPRLGIYAEIEGLLAVRQPLIALKDANPAAATEPLRQFALVATRYHALAATQLEQGKVPAIHRDDYISLLNLVHDILPWAVEELGVKKIPPALRRPIGPHIEQQQWNNISHRATAWQQLLIDKLEFKDKEVALKPTEKKDDQ